VGQFALVAFLRVDLIPNIHAHLLLKPYVFLFEEELQGWLNVIGTLVVKLLLQPLRDCLVLPSLAIDDLLDGATYRRVAQTSSKVTKITRESGTSAMDGAGIVPVVHGAIGSRHMKKDGGIFGVPALLKLLNAFESEGHLDHVAICHFREEAFIHDFYFLI